jgi:3-oxoacyl-[acyl-carrier protein] reductase
MSRVAIITGAARGIGRGIAEHLYEKGYDVALVDVLESVKQTASEIGPEARVTPYIADIRSQEEVKALMKEVYSKYGQIDSVVNVAGTNHRNSFEDTTLEAWDLDIATNLTGSFLMCQSAIFPYMKQQNYGRIVNIASVAAKTGGIGPIYEDGRGGKSGIAYASSKAGLVNMTKWIAKEVGKYGITCNSIAPGYVETDMTRGNEYDLSQLPVKRNGTPYDIAHATEFLLQKESSYITGVCLHVDGGSVMS